MFTFCLRVAMSILDKELQSTENFWTLPNIWISFWLTVYFRFKYKIFAIMVTFFHSSYKTVNSSVHKREWEHLNTEHHQRQDGCFALPCDGFLNGLPSNCGLIVSLSLVKLSDCLTSATPSPVSSDKSASHFETCLAIVIYVLETFLDALASLDCKM